MKQIDVVALLRADRDQRIPARTPQEAWSSPCRCYAWPD